MGALPKKKHTVHRQGRRRATIKLATTALVECQSCHAKKRAHYACEQCGSTK
jgi:ribosomal protein L32